MQIKRDDYEVVKFKYLVSIQVKLYAYGMSNIALLS
jgi:hypothetical protein